MCFVDFCCLGLGSKIVNGLVDERGLYNLESDTKSVTGLTGRYAWALFQLADEQVVLEKVAEDLATISNLIEENKDLARLVRSPVVSRIELGTAMMSILEKAGAFELTKNFIGLVASNRRLFALNGIISDYLQILADRRGQVNAEVTSAEPLNERQMKQLLNVFKTSLGEKVKLTTKVDQSLLGGLVVKIGSRMVDSSLRNKLQRMRLNLRGVG